MFFEQVAVGHAGQVVADGAVQAVGGDAFRGGVAEQFWPREVGLENIAQQRTGALVRTRHARMVVEVRVEKFPQRAVRLEQRGAVADERRGLAAHVVGARHFRGGDEFRAGRDHVLHLPVDDAADDVAAQFLAGEFGEMRAHFLVAVLPRGLLGELLGRDEVEVEAVVEVVAVVGDLVGEVGDLRFERGAGKLPAISLRGRRRVVEFGVLLQTLAHFPREIQAGKARVFLLDEFDDAEALAVVLEAAVVAHQAVQQLLAAVAERRMPEVVGERDGFGEVFIQPQRAGDGAADGRHLDGVGQARAEVVAGAVEKDLRLVLEPPEGP